MHRKRHTVILTGTTALRAIRRERRISGELNWSRVELDEQVEALKNATCLTRFIDLEDLDRMGLLNKDEKLDVAVMRTAKRTPSSPVHIHCISNLTAGGLMYIGKDLYILSPAALLLDFATSLQFEELLALAEEFCGNWSLPDKELEPEDIASSLDFLDKPYGYYEAKPALSVEELKAFRDAAIRMRGRRASEAVVRYAVGGSRSPMEAIMNCMYALPHEYGGLACGPIKTNHKIELNSTAQALSNLPYILADAFLPRFNTVLEYNGSYHDESTIRRRDEARTLGLMSMGIDVYRLNSDQLRDIEALEAIARMIYQRSGRHYRPRSRNYNKKRAALLEGLRRAFGLR